jgi:hypothetical protein
MMRAVPLLAVVMPAGETVWLTDQALEAMADELGMDALELYRRLTTMTVPELQAFAAIAPTRPAVPIGAPAIHQLLL